MANNQGRGRGQGRGNQKSGGRGRSNFRKNKFNANDKKEIKFAPQGQGKGQTATYATVKDAIIHYIQKTYKNGEDVVKSLKNGKLIDMKIEEPKREILQESDETSRQIEQDGLNIRYQEELQRHLDRKDELKRGINRACALFFKDYCIKAMQNRVEEHPEFSSKIEDDPI